MIKATQNAKSGSQPLDRSFIGPRTAEQGAAEYAQDRLEGLQGFYKGVYIPEALSSATVWEPGNDLKSGSQVNKQITQVYTTLDKGMTAYLGEPRFTNWCTFGKYASANAGVQINRLESLMKAVHAKGLNSKGVASGLALLADGLTNPKESLAAAKALHQVDLPGRSFMDKAAILRKALVNGNIAIINDIAPAFDTFLRAESAGKDGLAALRAAGYGREPLDRHKLLLRAFENYVQARKLSGEIKRRFTPEQLRSFEQAWRNGKELPAGVKGRDEFLDFMKLVNRRQNEVLQANLLLGFHEQLVSLQSPKVFEHAEVAKLMEGMSRGMVFEDVRGKTPLLPNGGNWADFTKRMGLKEVPPETTFNTLSLDGLETADMLIELKDPDGTVRKYFTSGLCERGTIAYFMYQANRAFDADTDRLLDSKPKPLPWLFKVSQ